MDDEAHHDLHTRLAVAIAGETSDDATNAMLWLICEIVARESSDLSMALNIVRGFTPDLEAAVTGMFSNKGANNG